MGRGCFLATSFHSSRQRQFSLLFSPFFYYSSTNTAQSSTMGITQSKKQYQNCNDNTWMDTTITVDFSKTTDQQLDSINLNSSEKISKSSFFITFFKNVGNKFKVRNSLGKTKKNDDIELDPIQVSQRGNINSNETLFGKFKSVARSRGGSQSQYSSQGDCEDDDTHGLIF